MRAYTYTHMCMPAHVHAHISRERYLYIHVRAQIQALLFSSYICRKNPWNKYKIDLNTCKKYWHTHNDTHKPRHAQTNSYGVDLVSRIDWIQVSFAKEPYKRDAIVQKKPIILWIVLTVATPYCVSSSRELIRMHICSMYMYVYVYACIDMYVYVYT